jgi:hypothetical protein
VSFPRGVLDIMGFLNLAGLAYLVSVPVLVWIYRRSRKKRRVEISSIIPWRVLKESVVRSSLFRADLLFWVQLALLLALVLAACRPYWQRGAVPERRRHFVVVMDRSASMQTMEGGKSRFDLARDRALKLARRLGARDRVTLVAAGARPAVLAAGEADGGRFETMLRGLEPADTPDGMAPALGMGMALLREGEKRRRAPGGTAEETYLYAFTDRSAESLGFGKETAGGAIRIERVGTPKGNAAITSLSVYTDLFSPRQTASAYVTVENLSSARYSGTLRALSGGREIASQPVALAPGAALTTAVGEALPEGLVEIALDPPDALRVDNRAWAMLTGRRTERIALFTRDPACVRAFKDLAAAIPHVELTALSPDRLPSTDMAPYHTAVFHRCEPEQPPASNLLLICPPVKSALAPVRGEWATDIEFLNWDESHPLGENLRGLNDVPLSGARVLSLPPWARPVVISATKGGDIPLVLCGRARGRKVVVMGYDAAEIDYRKAGSLPALVLLLNSLKWLGTDERAQVKTGEPYEALLPEASGPAGSAKSFTVIDPHGKETAVSAAPGEPLVFAGTDYAGRYLLSGGEVSRSFAANLCSRAESDLRGDGEMGDRVTVEEVVSVSVPPPPPPDRSAGFLLAAAALMLADWLLFSMRRRAASSPTPVDEGES